MLCVDNTFASPYLQNPLDLGADIVMHSATKYLGGHSDVIHGCLMMNDKELRDELYFIQKSCGPFRVRRIVFLFFVVLKPCMFVCSDIARTGRKLLISLRNHPKVEKVYWCGFEDHPNFAIAKKQMRGFGGMMSFTLKDDSVETASKVLSSTKVFAWQKASVELNRLSIILQP